MYGIQLDSAASRAHMARRFPALTVEDIEAYCKYTQSTFHEHGGQGRDFGDVLPTRMFRIRSGVPTQILEISYQSVLEWKDAMEKVGERVETSGRYRHAEFGEVVTVGIANRTVGGRNGDPKLIFLAGEELLYSDPSRFFGATYVHISAKWVPTAVFLGHASEDDLLGPASVEQPDCWFDVRSYSTRELFEAGGEGDGGIDGFPTLAEAIAHANSDEFVGDYEVIVIAFGHHEDYQPMQQLYSRFGQKPR